MAIAWWGNSHTALRAASAGTSRTVADTAAVERPIEVQVVAAEVKPIPRYLLATGELQADKEAAVAADASGKVVAVPIERGATVEQGQLLVKLDDRSAALTVRRAQANLELVQTRSELANNDLERNRPLADAHAIAASEFQRLEADQKARVAELQVARVQLETAEKALKDTCIYSPFAGTISDRLVQIGEYVRADSAVARLVDTRRLRLLLNIPEPSVSSIQPGQDVLFTVGTYPDREFAGKVYHIGPAVRSASRDLLIEVDVDNAEGLLRPGFFASARLRLADAQAVVVPSSAVRSQGGSSKVYVVQNGHAVERLVDLGESRDTVTEVRRGLTPKESVILAPGADITDGIQVSVETVG